MRGGPVVTADAVVFRLPDPEHELDGVRLEVDWILGDIDPEFRWADGLLVAADRRGRTPGGWNTSSPSAAAGLPVDQPIPGNPRRVPNPFGDKSEIRFPDYREPNWLLTAPAGPVRTVETPAGRLDQPVPVRLWSPTGLSADTAAPLLLVHDGSDMAERGSLLSWATAMSRDQPIRVALLDPPHGLRDEWYAADPDYCRPPRRGRAAGPDVPGADRPGDRARREPGRAEHAGPATPAPGVDLGAGAAVRVVLHPGTGFAGEPATRISSRSARPSG